MTILTVCQSAALRVAGRRASTLSSIFSSTEQLAAELADAANEAAQEILKRVEWRDMSKIATITGDGIATEHNLPSDYERMPKEAVLYKSSSTTPLLPARDLDHWTQIVIDQVYAAPGYWILMAGKLQILPALGSGVTVKFPYQKNTCITGGTKTAFTSDSDTFDLSERVLTLGTIWKWRANKGLEKAEDLPNFEGALAEEAGRDKGARILRTGRARGDEYANYAYPGALGS